MRITLNPAVQKPRVTRMGMGLVMVGNLFRDPAILIMGKRQGKPLKRLDRSGGVVHPTEVGC